MSDEKNKVEEAEGKAQLENSLPPWDCQIKPYDKEPVASLDSLYVGDLFLLQCKGDFVENLKSPIQISHKEEADSYGLVLLEERTLENSQIWAVATSYKPGEHSFEKFQLKSGEQVIPLGGGTWKLKSALAERPAEVINNPESQNMMFKGPFELPMPLWYIGLWVALILVIGALVYKIVRKRIQRKKVLEDISRKSTALTPYNQFNKEIRQHMRRFTSGAEDESQVNYMIELDQSFKLYLTRELLVPATEWKVGSIMSELKSRHKKVYKRVGPQVRRTLVEFERAQKARASLSWDDCEQMRDMSRRVVDNVYRIKRVSQ